MESHSVSAGPTARGGLGGQVSLGERTRTRVARPAGQQPAHRAVKPPMLTHEVPEPNAEKTLNTRSSGDESWPNRGGGAKGSTRQ